MGDAVGGWTGEVGFEVVACLWGVCKPEGGAGDDGDTFGAVGAVGEGWRTGSRCRRVCRVGEIDGQCSSFSLHSKCFHPLSHFTGPYNSLMIVIFRNELLLWSPLRIGKNLFFAVSGSLNSVLDTLEDSFSRQVILGRL